MGLLSSSFLFAQEQAIDTTGARRRAMTQSRESSDAVLPTSSPFSDRLGVVPQELTPSASSICQYGNTNVNSYRGLPRIKIPLEKLTAQGHEISAWLSYDAGGNKPDNHPGWVGMGWSLHAGGMVSRLVNGYKDELSIEEASRDEDYEFTEYTGGYLHHCSVVQESQWVGGNTLTNNGNKIPANKKIYADYEPDEFFVEVEDLRASFYIVGSQAVAIKSATPEEFKVEYVWNQSVTEYSFGPGINYSGKLYGYLSSFTIIRSDGTRYTFGGTPTTIECSFVEHAGELVGTVNSWLLKEIQYPNGEVVSFHYEKDGAPLIVRDIHTRSVVTADITIGYVGSNSDHYVRNVIHDTRTPDDENRYHNYYYTLVSPSYLTRIESERTGKNLSFERARSSELPFVYNEAAYNARVKTSESMPSLSAVLMNNYYMKLVEVQNNESDASVFFSYLDTPNRRLRLAEISLGDGETRDMKYSFDYNDSILLPGYNTKMTDMWGYYCGRSYEADSWEEMRNRRQIDTLCMQAEMLRRVHYPTGGYSEYEYEVHSCGTAINDYGVVFPQQNQVGGLRIKRIIDYSDNVSEPVVREYSYELEDGVSSGIMPPIPWYSTTGFDMDMSPFVAAVTLDGTPLMGMIMITYTSHTYCEEPVNLQNYILNDGVAYGRVEERIIGGGKTVVSCSSQLNEMFRDWKEEASMNAGTLPFSSRAVFRGLPVLKEVYDESGRRVEDIRNHYQLDTTKFVKAFKISPDYPHWKYHAYRILTSFPALEQTMAYSYPDCRDTIKITSNYSWNAHRQLVRTVKSVSVPENESVPSDTLVEERFYARDYQQSGFEGVDYPAMTAGGMGGVPVETVVSSGGKLVSAELTEWKYDATSGCYLPYRRSTASPSEYAYTGGGLYNGSNSPSAYDGPANEVVRYDGRANPEEIHTSSGESLTYFWDGSCRLSGKVLGARRDSVVRVWPEVYHAQTTLDLSSTNSPQYNFVVKSDTLGTLTITLSLGDGLPRSFWGRVGPDSDSLYFHCPSSELTGGRLYTTTFYDVPAGNHNVRLTTDPDHWLPADVVGGVPTLLPSPGVVIEPQLDTLYTEPGLNEPVPEPEYPEDPLEPGGPGEPGDPSNPGSQDIGPGGTPLWGEVCVTYSILLDTDHPREEREAVLFSFEEDGDYADGGFHSERAQMSPKQVNVVLNLSRNYVMDMHVLNNGVWEYRRASLSAKRDNGYTLYADGLPFDEVRIYPEGAEVETYTWWGDGNLRSRTDGRGVTESYEYDGLGRLTAVRDNAGHKVDGYEYRYATWTDPIGI